MGITGWNREFALEQAVGDESLLQELIDLFKTSFENDFRKIESGIGNNDCAQVASAAHSIKGAAASLGIEGLSNLAKEIEMDSKSGKLNIAKELLSQLRMMLQEVKGF